MQRAHKSSGSKGVDNEKARLKEGIGCNMRIRVHKIGYVVAQTRDGHSSGSQKGMHRLPIVGSGCGYNWVLTDLDLRAEVGTEQED